MYTLMIFNLILFTLLNCYILIKIDFHLKKFDASEYGYLFFMSYFFSGCFTLESFISLCLKFLP